MYTFRAKCMYLFSKCVRATIVDVFRNVSILPFPHPHNKHSNIQYQFLSILPSPDPHNTHSNIQYQFLSILPSLDPHNKHSNIPYQLLSILPSPDPHNKHNNIHNVSSLSLQITATHQAIKTDSGANVTAVGCTCCWILALFGDGACKCDITVS